MAGLMDCTISNSQQKTDLSPSAALRATHIVGLFGERQLLILPHYSTSQPHAFILLPFAVDAVI